jgi:hypothetical protein
MRQGSWESELVEPWKDTDLVAVVKRAHLAPSANTLPLEDPRKHVGKYVYFVTNTGERSILRQAKLIGIHDMVEDGAQIIELLTPFKPNHVGGPIFSEDGSLLGVITDGPFHSKDGLSSFGLSSLDLQRLWEGSSGAVGSSTDADICTFALSGYFQPPHWNEQAAFRSYVDEAKRRGLMPESCANLLGWENAQSEAPPPEDGDIEERLRTLKGLYDKGLITKEEHDRKRGEILEGL